MTISSTTRIAGPFVGNGTASVFPFTFKVFTAADLQVIRLIVSSGIEQQLVLNSDYTVTLNGNQNTNPGGNITLAAGALQTGYTLTITSDISNLQPTDLTNQGGFYPEVITDSLDRATIQIQQISDIGDRAIKVPLSDGAVAGLTLPTAVQRANAFLAFDAAGDPVAVTGGTSGAPATVTRQTFSGDGTTVSFTLASAPGGLGNSALVYINGICQERSTYSIGGTTLLFSQAPVAGTNNIEFVNFLTTNIGTTDANLVQYTPSGTGATAITAQTKFAERVSVKDFGAVGNGVTDDTTAFTNAIAAAGTRDIFVPGGSYVITGTVTGNFYSDATVTITGGTVNTINRIGSTLSTTGNATFGGNLGVSGTVTATALAVTTVTATSVAGSLTSNNSVSTANITAGAVTAPKLAARVTFPDYANGVNITPSSGTVYQAATDLYVVATGFNQFMGSIELYVGTTSGSQPTRLWYAGDDINSNTKYFGSGAIPIPQGFYWRLDYTTIENLTLKTFPVFTA